VNLAVTARAGGVRQRGGLATSRISGCAGVDAIEQLPVM
jgi:hypothetical protein